MNPKYPSPYKHAAFAQQYHPEFLLKLFALADKIRANPRDFKNALEGKVVALLFYRESTRTRFSFCTAILRLGGQFIETENAEMFSSATKGESLAHTIRVVSGYADAIVLRHENEDAPKEALRATLVPFINAGCGSGQHLTQALTDAYTVYQHFGTLENLDIALVGDLARGRTCRSLAYVFSLFPSNRFFFVSPPELGMRDDIKEHLRERGCAFSEYTDVEDILVRANVLYMTRVQKERPLPGNAGTVLENPYHVSLEDARRMPPNAIIMHPLPIDGEIATEVDTEPNAHYFRQSDNGMWIRMALLYTLLGGPLKNA